MEIDTIMKDDNREGLYENDASKQTICDKYLDNEKLNELLIQKLKNEIVSLKESIRTNTNYKLYFEQYKHDLQVLADEN